MSNSDKTIRPEILYTMGDAAARIGKSADWFKRELILTDQIQYTPMGETYMILGEWLIHWCVQNSVRKSERPSKRRPKKNEKATAD